MKRKCFFMFFVLFFVVISAQKKVVPMYPLPKNTDSMACIDSMHIRILYALNATDVKKPETYDDLQRLEIGKHISKYYSSYVFNSDSLVTKWKKKHPKAQSYSARLGARGKIDGWSEYHYSEFFKDLTNNTFTEYSRLAMYMQHSNGKYTEKIPVQNWKVHKETQIILGYLCQKATCRFSGRNYTAWFTRDVPVKGGPWKFGGLPGLILKVYDDNKLYTFECIKIENFKKKLPIMIYKDYEKYKEISRKELLRIQRMINEDFLKTTGARNYKTKEPRSVPSIYHPIEIE